MENHELGTHNDRMCAAILTGNSQNTPQLIRPIRQNRPIIWDFLEKKSPSHVHTHQTFYFIQNHFFRFLYVLQKQVVKFISTNFHNRYRQAWGNFLIYSNILVLDRALVDWSSHSSIHNNIYLLFRTDCDQGYLGCQYRNLCHYIFCKYVLVSFYNSNSNRAYEVIDSFHLKYGNTCCAIYNSQKQN